MQIYKDTFQMFEENAVLELAILSVLGDREEQQDSIGFELRPTEGFIVLCDGMGGHEGGKLASSLAVSTLLKDYNEVSPISDIYAFLLDTICNADQQISLLTNKTGECLHAGSTAVAVFVKDTSLFWVSVGDSRLYLSRGDELVRVTEDHIYQTLLDEKRQAELISDEEYRLKSKQGEALISFLGINGLPKIDINENAFPLKKGDKIILMSDGLYKLVADFDIKMILDNFSSIEEALKALEMKAFNAGKKRNIKRDNMTVAILKMK